MINTRFFLVLLAFISLQNAGFSRTIIPPSIQPGKCLAVRIVSEEGVMEGKVSFLHQQGSLYRSGDGFKAIIGVPVEQKAGHYPLLLMVRTRDGKEEKTVRQVKVSGVKFPAVSFWLKPAKKKLLANNLINEEWARIEKVLVNEDDKQQWGDKFLFPVRGPASMLFGTIERINGKRTGQHRGFDLAVPVGTKVIAPNNGKIVFAEKLKAFGGTVVIDHGQGIHTLYFHLSKFLAKVGQDVSKGDIIALSGNSGISSGPHLHWGMSVHNLRVDPAQWTRYAF